MAKIIGVAAFEFRYLSSALSTQTITSQGTSMDDMSDGQSEDPYVSSDSSVSFTTVSIISKQSIDKVIFSDHINDLNKRSGK